MISFFPLDDRHLNYIFLCKVSLQVWFIYVNCLKSESSFQVIWKILVKWASSHPEMNALYTAKQGIEPHFMILVLSLKQTHKQIMKVVYWRLHLPFLKPHANSPQQSDTRTFPGSLPQQTYPATLAIITLANPRLRDHSSVPHRSGKETEMMKPVV